MTRGTPLLYPPTPRLLQAVVGQIDKRIVAKKTIFRKRRNLLCCRDMGVLKKLAHSRSANIVLGIVLSGAWIMFALTHVRAYFDTGEYAYLVFCASESLQALLFLFRTMPKVVSTDPFDWLVAGGGTLAPLFFRPTDYSLWIHGDLLIVGAVVLQVIALLSLNRSFGIVAANRAIKTHGAYLIVRHPMYSSYIFLFAGYFLLNTSLLNAGLVALAWIFMIFRIIKEEQLLCEDALYRKYKDEVKWRLIPFVY